MKTQQKRKTKHTYKIKCKNEIFYKSVNYCVLPIILLPQKYVVHFYFPL